NAIVMVVDARSELAAPDLELARLLQRTGKPLFLAANKVDSHKQESLTDNLHCLGIRNLVPISAEHGRGIDDLLDAMVEALPAESLTTEDTEAKEESIRPIVSRRKLRARQVDTEHSSREDQGSSTYDER